MIIHDVDYFPDNNIFGKKIDKYKYDFSDCFTKWKLYYPKKFAYHTGPPTLVGSNTGFDIDEYITDSHPTYGFSYNNF